jgi:ABC-type nitrate/sulfonate/bicarbonate transport system substrate-binding protein
MRSTTTRTTKSGGRGAHQLKVATAFCGVSLALAVLVALGGCGGAETAATAASPGASAPAAVSGVSPEVGNVTLIMDWVPWVLDIPVDVAQEKGYYAGAGLKVKQILPAGATDVVKFVATGRAQFGLYYAPDILMGVGEGAPLLSIGSLMGHAPVGLAIAPGVQASKPSDLVGKVVGVSMIPSTRASFASLLKAGGVDPGKVKVADPGFSLVAPLLRGTYQAVAFTKFGELVEARAEGKKLAFMDFRDWGTPDYAFLNMITSSGFAQAHPKTTRAFAAATLAGLDYAARHPEEAVNIYVARHPEMKRSLLLAQWEAAIPYMATGGAHPAGWQDLQTWGKLNDWLVQAKLLNKAVDVGRATSNAYLARQ